MIKPQLYLVGDFETTVYENQDYTEVWASAIVPMYSEEVQIFHSIGETFNYLRSLNKNIVVYYHNLKFDGAFWLQYLLTELKFKQAITGSKENLHWMSDRAMPSKSFKYSISDKGIFYSIFIRVSNQYIEIRDSYKLIPMSVNRIGRDFHTKHTKSKMEYKGYRYAGCPITEDEQYYIKNDVLVVKEALELMFDQGHDQLTIGACCMKEFKKCYYKDDYKEFFPNLYSDCANDFKEYSGYSSYGEYIRKSYKGAWCYVVKGKECKLYSNGITVDVNSLYPSVMHSSSRNYYPVGYPRYWKGNFIPDKVRKFSSLYFIRIRCRFQLKPGYLPFLQIKGTFLYNGRECLTTSDYKAKDGQYYRYYMVNGELVEMKPELILTSVDFELLKEHYELYDLEIIDGLYFNKEIGLFDKYINKYKELKENSEGGMREIAKLFLNNLYGKFATSTDSSFKLAYLKEDGSLGFTLVEQYDKVPGYIAIGSFITSYARAFTIRHAQVNYHGVDKPGFIYADTDSCHMDIPEEEMNDIILHPTNFGAWKIENRWEIGWFVRAKTYIEKNEEGYLIKCAGMPENCKDKFIEKLESRTQCIEDFRTGFKIDGKLMPKHIPGGILLKETTFQIT